MMSATLVAGALGVVEAENYTASFAGVGSSNGQVWETVSDTTASGGQAVEVLNNISVNTGDAVNGARLDYALQFEEAGEYHVSVRMFPDNSADNSVHIGLNGAPVTYGGFGLSNEPPFNASWIWLNDVSNNGPQNITITVPQPGVHMLNMWMREDGTRVDKIVINRSSDLPTGLGPAASQVVETPYRFLLFDPDELDELRAKASSEPWKTLAQAAANYTSNSGELRNVNTVLHGLNIQRMSHFLSVQAIFEENPSERAFFASRVVDMAEHWHEAINDLDPSAHQTWVQPTSSFYASTLLAGDMYWQDMSDAQRTRFMAAMEPVIRLHRETGRLSHFLHEVGLAVIWAVFTANPHVAPYATFPDLESIDTRVQDYANDLLNRQISQAGTWAQSPTYLDARIGNIRFTKALPMDILSRRGLFDFYNHPQAQKAFIWYATVARTPYGGWTSLGDTLAQGWEAGDNNGEIGPFYRFGNYGEELGAIANWYYDQTDQPGPTVGFRAQSVFDRYVLYKRPTEERLRPQSRVFEDFGAAFREPSDSKEALFAVLRSPQDGPDATWGHDLQQVNAIHLTAYGQDLLLNSGTAYTNADASGFNFPGFAPNGNRWFDANFQNVVQIGESERHASFRGAGVLTGVVGGATEYTRTDAGVALGGGSHQRGLFFIPPVEGESLGFFVLSDEVRRNNTADNIRILLQPNTRFDGDGLQTITAGKEYVAHADALKVYNEASIGGERLRIVYADPPDNLVIEQSFKAGTGDNSQGERLATARLNAIYTGGPATVRALTVLFPEDDAHTAPPIATFNQNAYSAARIDHGSVTDHVLALRTSTPQFFNGHRLVGKDVYLRTDAAGQVQRFLVHGREFQPADGNSIGFTADQDITLELDETSGTIDSPGATVTWTLAGPSDVFLNDQLLNDVAFGVDAQGNTTATAQVPQGRHQLSFRAQLAEAVLLAPRLSLVLPDTGSDSTGPAVQVTFPTQAGVSYVVLVSIDGVNFQPMTKVTGTGSDVSVIDPSDFAPSKLYKVEVQ